MFLDLLTEDLPFFAAVAILVRMIVNLKHCEARRSVQRLHPMHARASLEDLS